MLTDLQRDILVKAAEGIQEGMWCQFDAFRDPAKPEGETWAGSLFSPYKNHSLTVEDIAQSKRCATGELAFRTVLLGGNRIDYRELVFQVGELVARECRSPRHQHDDADGEDQITVHNDRCIPRDTDPFSAGQEWVRIFRQVAEA